MVFGFEPGDVMLALRPIAARAVLFLLDQAEAHEGVHLVTVAAHVLGQLLHPPHIGIGLVFHHPPVRLQTPQQPVEQREAFGIGMEDGVARQRHEALARPHRPGIGRRNRCPPLAPGEGSGGGCGEQIPAAAGFDPGHPVGGNLALHQRTRAFAPELEIVRLGQINHVIGPQPDMLQRGHAANSSNCSVLGASRLRKSARSVSSTGRQSNVQMNGRTLVTDWVSRATSSRRNAR